MKKIIIGLLSFISLSVFAGPWQPLEYGFDVEFKNKAVFTKDDRKIGSGGLKCSTVSTEENLWVALEANGVSALAIKVENRRQADQIIATFIKTNVCD